MLDAQFCRAFCLNTLLGLLLNGSISGDDSRAKVSANFPDAHSSVAQIGTQTPLTVTEQTLLSGDKLPFLSVPDKSPTVAENPQTPVETLQENNNAPADVKDDTFLVYSYLNYITMSCASALDDPDHFPGKLFYFSSAQDVLTSIENPGDRAAESQGMKGESSAPLAAGRRPLNAIRLADSIIPLDDSGQPLARPEDSNPQATASKPVEHHYVPAPWHRSHASRNTYPIRYQPLYFEDPNMERCGESGGCLTEIKSIAHFAGRIPLLPYMMASDSPHKCVRALPDCPTCQQFGPEAYLPRPTVKAIAAQAAATVGVIYLIP